MSDMAPKIEPGGSVLVNSANHRGGQNVMFADCHAEFLPGPVANGDNLWTHNKDLGPSPTGTIISGGSVGAPFGSSSPPYDVIMVPIRDGSGVTH